MKMYTPTVLSQALALALLVITCMCNDSTSETSRAAHVSGSLKAHIDPETIQRALSGVEGADRTYWFRKVGGAGCPYAGSWLIDTNLFIKSHWWLTSTKMEEASFNIFSAAQLKFQMSDPDAFYVHHLSIFEHYIHKRSGFEAAQNATLQLSKAALRGECGSDLRINDVSNSIGLVPFYGGLPPNVTKDLSVKSLGQGNSLVSAPIKAMQALATVCSLLKYFGRVVIGTARTQDYQLINDLLNKARPAIRDHVHVISLQTSRPAHLPFHLLAWGQLFVKEVNCPPPDIRVDYVSAYYETGYLPAQAFTGKSQEFRNKYRICTVNLAKNHHVNKVDVNYHNQPFFKHYEKKKEIIMQHVRSLAPTNEISVENAKDTFMYFFGGNKGKVSLPQEKSTYPSHIQYIYYTEQDQIVRFDSLETLRAITSALNESTFFVGPRREKLVSKHGMSEPELYMSNLTGWRTCGQTGYRMIWPKENTVHFDETV
jgi:hypothetical protein